ncbi:MAG: ABC transporter permease [Firmicutes bacterium]|nr:ABC transporter permease [Bacillota bacterium]
MNINRIILIVVAFQYLFYRIFLYFKQNRKNVSSENKNLINILGSVIAILIGFIFGLILMLIVNPSQALEGFSIIIIGGFNEGFESIGNMIYFSVPIILTGLSVAFAFRTGLFNIGATGQLTMGAFTAVYIGVKWSALGEISPILHWGVAILFALIAGAVWGAIPGFLKAYRNVNEVVSAIMLNYVAMYLNTYLIKKYIYNQSYARAMDIKATAATPDLNLQYLFPNTSINAGIIVAIVVVIILYIILNKTTFGYELKAVGFNREASRYAGMNAKRNIVLSMMISGAVAGLAGAMIFLVIGKNLKPENVLLSEGFTGIAISLLGLSSPFGVLIAGLFFGSLQQGGYYLQLLNFKPEIIDIIIAVIIYVSALGLIIQKLVLFFMKRKETKVKQANDSLEGGDK